MKKFALILLLFFSAASFGGEYISPSFRVLNEHTSVNWHDTSFQKTVNWMENDVGWNVSVRWSSLQKIGITKDSTVNLTLIDVPVRVVLNECLQQLSSDITYHLRADVLTIASRSHFDKRQYIRAYDVTDILMTFACNGDAPSTDLRSLNPSPFYGDIKEVPNCLEQYKKQLENIILLIEPQSWSENKGKGSLKWFGDVLVIINTIEVHELIAGNFYE